ncbi:MmgE/PrpD family protein [Chloroflexota bacterium]
MDASYAFAKNLTTLKYEDIPQDVVDITKKHVLDVLGCAMGGSSKAGVRELLELVTEWGGKEESTILCFGNKFPTPNAAQVNATMCHALDYDDTGSGPVHASAVIVPTCLTIAERQGKFSGKEFITAVTLGLDMICRLGLAFNKGLTGPTANGHPGAGWHLTPLYGFLAAAGVSGRIIGLSEEEIVNALGIAYHQCAGNGQCVVDGALTKRMGPGFAAKGGITAALMAQKGITGAPNCIEGECGLYPLYHQGKYDAKALTADLGKHFEGTSVSMKPFPCCMGTHGHVRAALGLVNEQGIKAEDVEEILLYAHGQGALSVPLEVKAYPRNLVDSQFSIPWAVAVVIAKGKTSIGDFTEEAIRNPDILKIADKIKLDMDTVPAESEGASITRMKVTTKNGDVYYGKTEGGLGGPRSTLPFSDYESKFRDCVSYAIKKLPDGNVDKVVEMIKNLEEVDDVREIIKLLS